MNQDRNLRSSGFMKASGLRSNARSVSPDESYLSRNPQPNFPLDPTSFDPQARYSISYAPGTEEHE